MDSYKNSKLGWLVTFCAFCLPLLSARAGAPSVLVEPGGVEIPVIVNVLGPQKPNDVNDVNIIITETNRILKQANVQLAVRNVNTGITQFGDGDGVLTEDEHAAALLASLSEMEGPRGPVKGVKINIADEIWAERSDLVFWRDVFYPVAFLERHTSLERMGRTLAREIGIAAGLPASPDDPGNLMDPSEEGTSLDENQSTAIRELAKQVGFERSPLAEGYAPEVLEALRCKIPGALFFSEGFTLCADPRGDVLANDPHGLVMGNPDLEAFIGKSGRIGASESERALTLKFYFGVPELPKDTYMDAFLRVYNPNWDASDVNDPNDPMVGDPLDTFDAVIGIGLPSLGSPYVGVINLLAGRDFIKLAGVVPVVEHDRDRTKVKAEIPFGLLKPHLSADLLERLNNGKGLEVLAEAQSIAFDLSTFTFVSRSDSIANIKLKAIPRPVPEIPYLSSLGEPPANTPTGLSVRFVRPVTPPTPLESLHDYLNGLFDGSIPVTQDVTGNYNFVNFSNSLDSPGYFSADNGYPDEPFLGVPGAGDEADNFALRVTGVVHLHPGLHILGAPGDGAAFLEIGGVKVGAAFPRDPPYPDVDNGIVTSILDHREWAFKVQAEGYYNLRLDAWMGTGRASLELTQVLPNGPRLLVGDVPRGGSRVVHPF